MSIFTFLLVFSSSITVRPLDILSDDLRCEEVSTSSWISPSGPGLGLSRGIIFIEDGSDYMNGELNGVPNGEL